MAKKVTTEDFILHAKKVHGEKYSYENSKYVNQITKVEILCPIHGRFFQAPKHHVYEGAGCWSCGRETTAKKLIEDPSEYLQKVKNKYGDKYDYSQVKYVNVRTPITIICKIHGSFSKKAGDFFHYGCIKCGRLSAGDKLRSNIDNFIKLATVKHGNRYDYSEASYTGAETKVKIICRKHGAFYQLPPQHVLGKGCMECKNETVNKNLCLTKQEFVDKANKRFNNYFDYSRAVYVNYRTKLEILCPKHGSFFQKPQTHLHKICGCRKCAFKDTGIEKFIKNILSENNIQYKEKDRKILKGKEIDIYIPSHNLAMECNGLYWHSEKRGKGTDYHLNKTNLCKLQGIKLLHIFDEEITRNPKLVIARIKQILGIQKYKVNSEDLLIHQVDPRVKSKFLKKYHFSGDCKSDINLGLFQGNRLVSLATFAQKKNGKFIMSRLCSIFNFEIIGGEAKLLSLFEQIFEPKSLKCFADKRWSSGGIYKNLGFNLIKETQPKHWNFKNGHYNLNKNPRSKDWADMQSKGWNRIWDCGNILFEKTYVSS